MSRRVAPLTELSDVLVLSNHCVLIVTFARPSSANRWVKGCSLFTSLVILNSYLTGVCPL